MTQASKGLARQSRKAVAQGGRVRQSHKAFAQGSRARQPYKAVAQGRRTRQSHKAVAAANPDPSQDVSDHHVNPIHTPSSSKTPELHQAMREHQMGPLQKPATRKGSTEALTSASLEPSQAYCKHNMKSLQNEYHRNSNLQAPRHCVNTGCDSP